MSFDAGSLEASLELDRDPFQAGLAAAKAEGDDFADEEFKAKATVDTDGVDSGIARAEAEGETFAGQTFTATAQVDTSAIPIALARALGSDALAQLVTGGGPNWASVVLGNLGFDANVLRWRQLSGSQGGQFATAAQIAALKAALGGGGGDSGIPADALAALEGAAGGAAAGGGGDSGGGLGGLFRAFWGQGSGGFLGVGRGLATFGTLASIMGFGAEHLLATLVGVGGSAMGGLLGGGFLGLGALGTAGVGMGTDLAGIGQAAGDISKVEPALSSLQSALATYGNASVQAAQAQDQLNTALDAFSPVAQNAVAQASQTISQFKVLFDTATGGAEKIGAEILNQAVQVGEQFLPTIGKYATENMGIIQRDLQPFFSWLQDPSRWGGLGIFNDLEQKFQNSLPAAMNALENGFELLGKTIDIASGYGGNFIGWIDGFVTRMNSVDFGKWSSFVTNMIGLFESWAGLIARVAGTIYDVFMPAVGAGKAVVDLLSGILGQIDQWLTSSSMSSALRSLFSVHLTELIQGLGGVITGVLPFIEAFAQAWVQVITVGAQVANAVLLPIAGLLHAIADIPFVPQIVGWIAALTIGTPAVLGFVSALMGIAGLRPLFTGAAADAGTFARALGALGSVTGIQAIVGAVSDLATTFGLLGTALKGGELGAWVGLLGESLWGLVSAAAPVAAVLLSVAAAMEAVKVHAQSEDVITSWGQKLAQVANPNDLQALQDRYTELANKLSALPKSIGGFWTNTASVIVTGSTVSQNAAKMIRDAMANTEQEMANYNDNLSFLEQRYGLTGQAALVLANTVGINLYDSMGKQGAGAIAKVSSALSDMSTQTGLTVAQLITLSQQGSESLTQLSQNVTQAVQQMTSNWQSFTDPVKGITAYMQQAQQQASAASSAQQAQAQAASQLASAQQQVSQYTNALANANANYAIAQQRYNQELAKGSGANQASLMQYQQDMATASQAISTAQQNIANATGSVTSAQQAQQQAAQQAQAANVTYVNGIQASLIPTAADIAGFYSNTLAQANAWVSNVQQALAEGYNPTVIGQVLSQGPAQAGPVLQAMVQYGTQIVGSNGQTMVNLVNQSTQALSQIGTQAILQARLMQIAINAPATQAVQYAQDFNQAVAAQVTLTAQASAQQVQAFVSNFTGGIPAFLRTVNEYAIALPTNVMQQLGLTGTAGNYQAGAYTGALGSQANQTAANTAGGSLSTAAANGMQAPGALLAAAAAGSSLAQAILTAVFLPGSPLGNLAPQVYAYIQSNVLSQDWPSLGKSMMQGIQQGITDSTLLLDPYINASPLGGYTYGGTYAGYQPPTYPHFAAGALVTSPTVALIAESGPELVLPLNDPARFMELLRSTSTGAQFLSALLPTVATGAIARGAIGATASSGGVTYAPTYRLTLAGPVDQATLAQVRAMLNAHTEAVAETLTELVTSGQLAPGG